MQFQVFNGFLCLYEEMEVECAFRIPQEVHEATLQIPASLVFQIPMPVASVPYLINTRVWIERHRLEACLESPQKMIV